MRRVGSPGHGIYRTRDGGQTWQRLTTGLPSTFGGKPQLCISASSPNIIFASIGNGFRSRSGTWLCKSVDGGDNWTVVSTLDYASAQGWYSHFVAVNPTDPNIVITGGQMGIFKSTAGGSDLQRKTGGAFPSGTPPPGGPEGSPTYAHADNHTFAFHPVDPKTIYFGNDGGVWRSTDGGETFQSCNGGYQTTQFYNGFSSAISDSLLAIGGMQDNWTAVYEGDKAWRRVYGGDGSWTAIHPTNPDIIYASSQVLNVVKSINRMESWILVRPPQSGNETTAFIAPFVISPANPDILYAGRSIIYKTTTAASSWFPVSGALTFDVNPAISMAISNSGSDTVYVGTAPQNARPGVFVTTNGGLSWENVTADLPDRYPLDIAVEPSRASTVYVVFGGFGSSHIYKSLDAGQSWIDIGLGLPDVPTSAVVVDPLYPERLHVGNDLGVYVSLDGGSSWQDFGEGLPEAVIVMDLGISPSNRKLRVATHGNGAYERRLLETTVSVAEPANVVTDFRLGQNYPNHFNSETTIQFELPREMEVTVSIYDVLGRAISNLIRARLQAGPHQVTWDARDFPSGIYFYSLAARDPLNSENRLLIQTKKLLLLR